jgi:putative ABC transport system permease protein
MKLNFIYLKRYIANYPLRLTFLILGVTVAVLFISFIGILSDSIHATNQEKRYGNYGEFQGMAIGISAQDAKALESNPNILAAAYSEVIGAAMAGFEKVYLGSMDSKAIGLTRLKLKDGSWPVNWDEIAIEDVTLKSLNKDAKIGDKIVIDMIVTQGQELKTVNQSFTLVGVTENKPLRKLLENSYATGGNGLEHAVMPTLFLSKDMLNKLSKEYTLQKNVIFELRDKSEAASTISHLQLSVPALLNVLYSPMNAAQLKQYDDTITTDNYILIIFIVIFAVIGIIQSFYITIQEREWQLGVLRAIGAMQRQIFGIVLAEAFIICMISIPLGILLSFAMLRFALFIIESFSGQAQVIMISSKTILISASLSLASVIFAAILPARRAMRVSPMTIISGVSAINFNKFHDEKEVKDSLLMNQKAVIPMALRNLKRQKSRSYMMAIIILLAVFTSVFSYNYDRMLAKDWKDMLQKDTTYSARISAMGSGSKLGKITFENGMTHDQINLITQLPGVSRVNSYKQLNSALIGMPIKENTDYYQLKSDTIIQPNANEWQQLQMAKLRKGVLPVNFKLVGVSDKQMAEIVPSYDVGDRTSAVLYVPLPNKKIEKIDFSDMGLKQNDTLSVVYNANKGSSDFAVTDFRLESVINSLPESMASDNIFKDNVCILINEINFSGLTNETLFTDVYVYTDKSISYKNTSFDEGIRKIAAMGRKLFVESRLEKMSEQNNESKLLMLRLYVTTGVSVLLTLFILSNVVISSVFSRKREFGMLRAVGMSKRQLNAMVSLENCILGFSAGTAGILLMILFVLMRSVTIKETSYHYSIASQFPWGFSLAAIIVTLLASMLISRLALKKALQRSIIDAIRHVE